MALSLKRKIGQVTNVTITKSKLIELARKGQDVSFYFRIYRINPETGECDVALVDDEKNFLFERDDWKRKDISHAV